MTKFGTTIDTLLSDDRICNLIKYSNACSRLGGYIFEAGIYKGGSLEILAKYNPGIDIMAVDSFEGVPKETEGKDYHRFGDFNEGVNFHSIGGYFKMVYPPVRIVKGFIPKAFEYFDEHTNFCFCHLDLDMYQSIKDALDFCLPRLLKGGMILMDDWKQRSTPGCELAVNDFFSEHPDISLDYRGEIFQYEGGPSHKQYLIVK